MLSHTFRVTQSHYIPKLTLAQCKKSSQSAPNAMASTCYPPFDAFSSLPPHILERIIAAAGTDSCGAAFSCRALLSAWRTALATDPHLAASILLSRAAVFDNPGQRAMWIVSQLYDPQSGNQLPAAPAASQRPETISRDVKRKKRACEGLLSSPQGVLARVLASDQERADYATAFVRALPPQVLDLAKNTSRIIIGALEAFYAGHIGVIVELLLRESQPCWVTVVAACQTLDARVLGACVAAYRADMRMWRDDPPTGLSDLGSESTWPQLTRASLVMDGVHIRVQSVVWLAFLLLKLEVAALRFMRATVHGMMAISSSGASSAAARGSTAAAAANAPCVQLPASVTQYATRAPAYPAAASLGPAAAAAAFVNYLAACSLDVYDTSRPPCHQRQQACHTQGETSTRTELPSSAPNPAALRHHHPALCPHCYTMAREAMQLPQSPAAHAATHSYCATARLLLERFVYGVAEPALVPFMSVRQVYGDAKDLAWFAWSAGRDRCVGELVCLLVAAGAVMLSALLVGMVLAWGLAAVLWYEAELAVAVLWWSVRWAPVQLLGVVKRGLGQLRRV